MPKIHLSYQWLPDGDAAAAPTSPLHHPLMALLQAVRSEGSISTAAKVLGLSYRHVWGELKRWEDRLGRDLIVWDKGQPARLTPFGEKLLWAERQAQARLAPQIEALHADLERAFGVAFDDNAQVLVMYASHDEGIAALRGHAAQSGLHLDIRFTGSVDAIAALNGGRCALAGFHTPPSPAPGTLAQRTYQPLLQPGLHKIIGFARRRQGLVVAAGNPLRLSSMAQVAAGRVRYVNRALGAGTRLLAQQCDLEPGELVWMGGDTHLYLNHGELVEAQLQRAPAGNPTMAITRKPDSIFGYAIEDFEVRDYAPQAHISAPVAV